MVIDHGDVDVHQDIDLEDGDDDGDVPFSIAKIPVPNRTPMPPCRLNRK